MHDRDREKATSIVHNLHIPKGHRFSRNPFFNKVEEEEPLIALRDEELEDIQ
jgi:hypothetical protein